MRNFEVLSNPRTIYSRMLKDISNAKRSIYLETYIYGNDKIGRLFRKYLEKKSKQGVEIKVLIDSWGTGVQKEFFSNLNNKNSQVRFFKEFRYVARLLSKNHERNHRKLLVIDNDITYVGSINITKDCLDWRELVLRIGGPISEDFSSSFMQSWNSYGKLSKRRIKTLWHKGFEILQDFPRDLKSITRGKYLKLIRSAKKEVLIETPYFIPPLRIRRALYKAVNRGVNVIILLPKTSDVQLIDIVRNRYLGVLHKKGINIRYYTQKVLHSKLLLVDNQFFLLGSSNLDYRSFLHQHEVNLFGKNREINFALKQFFNEGIKNSKPFNYQEWKSRSSFNKIVELFFSLIERYL